MTVWNKPDNNWDQIQSKIDNKVSKNNIIIKFQTEKAVHTAQIRSKKTEDNEVKMNPKQRSTKTKNH